MSDALNDRRKELEEAFFAKQNKELVEKLKATKQKGLDKDGIKEATGIANDEVLEKLVSMSLTAETITALALFPLVQVAWADGVIDAKEKAAVLEAAEKSGILKGSSALALLEGWLKLKPPSNFEATWRKYVQALCEGMKAEDKALLKNELLGKARAVAESSGGILGMGNKVSSAEDKALRDLEAAFK